MPAPSANSVSLSPGIKNLIFDLGGVILNLSIPATLAQLATRANLSPETILERYRKSPELLAYEKGLISDAEFRRAMQQVFSFQAPDSDIDECWSAMLGDIPAARIDLLKKLRSRFKLFLLSNTNSIHVDSFSRALMTAHGIPSLDSLFDKAYYSHVMKMRKPDAEIFQRVIDENQLKADETLFLDDFPENLAGAQKVGLHTFHVVHPDLLFTLFA